MLVSGYLSVIWWLWNHCLFCLVILSCWQIFHLWRLLFVYESRNHKLHVSFTADKGNLLQGNLIKKNPYSAGTPAPKVKWFQNGQELPTETTDFSYPSRTTNRLLVKSLSRIHQHAVYTCQASNFPNKFVTKNITIELYCKYNRIKKKENRRSLSLMNVDL